MIKQTIIHWNKSNLRALKDGLSKTSSSKLPSISVHDVIQMAVNILWSFYPYKITLDEIKKNLNAKGSFVWKEVIPLQLKCLLHSIIILASHVVNGRVITYHHISYRHGYLLCSILFQWQKELVPLQWKKQGVESRLLHQMVSKVLCRVPLPLGSHQQ